MFFIKTVRKLINFFDQFQQKKIISFFKRTLNYPSIIIDVGAHHGETIELFKSNLEIKKLYSFEASPNNFKILEEKINRIDKKNVTEIYNMALGENNTTGFINETKETSSSTINNINLKSKYFKRKLKVLNIKKGENFFSKVPIKIITLDRFIKENNIDKIDMLKMDTEGYEFSVLKGVEINHHKIKFIYFEHHYDDMIKKNYKFSDINRILIKYGFKKISKYKMIFRKSFEYIYENQKK